jgi:hypothetical protein
VFTSLYDLPVTSMKVGPFFFGTARGTAFLTAGAFLPPGGAFLLSRRLLLSFFPRKLTRGSAVTSPAKNICGAAARMHCGCGMIWETRPEEAIIESESMARICAMGRVDAYSSARSEF